MRLINSRAIYKDIYKALQPQQERTSHQTYFHLALGRKPIYISHVHLSLAQTVILCLNENLALIIYI